LALACGLVTSGTAQAALHDRGNGFVYDDAQNLTWLADANLAASLRTLSSIYADGSMKRDIVDLWVAGLNHDSYLGFNDWRLPQATYYLDSNFGHLLTGSEFDGLFAELGGVSGTSIFTTHNGNLDLFQNIQPGFYWTSWIPGTGSAWTFSFANGDHNANYGSAGHVMLVLDGDVAAVPEPTNLAMMLVGAGLILIVVRRRIFLA
jgi:hypothetical protein